ncbi:MAG TPA: MATE family efflux transporter, partial [Smithellaceae bacterium]|nr:MATE family efflux transporter [Smithellaceae bacterium]
LIAITVPALRFYLSVLTITATIIIFINMFMGLGKGNLAMLLLLFRDTVLLIPLLIILPNWFGITGVWLAIPVSFVLSFIVVLYFALKELERFKSQI